MTSDYISSQEQELGRIGRLLLKEKLATLLSSSPEGLEILDLVIPS